MDCILDRSPALRAAATHAGFTSSARHWHGWHVAHRFACANGHTVMAPPAQLLAGRLSCLRCAALARLAELHAQARIAGVTCSDRTWRGAHALYSFRCPQGHRWKRQGSKARRQASCPQCAQDRSRQRRLLADGMAQLQQAARLQGGQCLSSEYQGINRSYLFQCAQGHQWTAIGNDVLHKQHWCGVCAIAHKRVAYRLDDGLALLQQAARAKGGTCLATSYTGQASQYRFRCAQGHEWKATGARIRRGGWCLICAREKLRLGIEVAQKIAIERGGQCLSDSYRNTSTPMHWLCDRGHSWQTTLATIRRGHWCPTCAHEAQITNAQSRARQRYQRVGTITDEPEI